MLIFSQVERWNIQFVVELRRFSVVHHVARRVGEVLEDQRTQVHAAGWADASAGEEYYLESYLTFEKYACAGEGRSDRQVQPR